MMTTTDAKKWEIWLAKVVYEDQPGVSKNRPVVVYSQTECFILSLKVSSQNPYTFRDNYELKKWKEAGLAKPSFVSLRFIKLIDKDLIHRLGLLQSADIRALEHALDELK